MTQFHPNVKYTADELDYAIFWALALGRSGFEHLMESAGRVAAHHMACERAFLDGLEGPNCEILRSAMRDLKARRYDPTDGVESLKEYGVDKR